MLKAVLIASLSMMMAGLPAGAQPLVATFTGTVGDGDLGFTAAFRYDSDDLVASGTSDFLDGTAGSLQWATYSDGTRTLRFDAPSLFTTARTESLTYQDDVILRAAVDSYTISSATGMLSLTFGGADPMGFYSLGADGLDYANLVPTSFSLDPEAVSAVPLPPALLSFAGALGLLAATAGTRKRRKAQAGTNSSATPLMQ